MKKIKEALRQELEKYKEINKKVSERLKDAPEGSLRVSYSNNVPQFYYYTKESSNVHGTYIPKSNRELAKKLAQKAYDKKLLNLTSRRIKQLSLIVDEYDENEIDDIYLCENKEKKKLIEPVEQTKSKKLQEWIDEKYEGKGFTEEDAYILTDRGERVRSKSEKILADYFNRNNIPYKYEKPLYIKGYGMIYPDFTFWHKETMQEKYWEHEGMMDDPRYATAAIHKIKSYEENGIFVGDRLILSYETRSSVLNTRDIERNVRRHLC